ncbi:KH domain-containing protein [Microbacterium sp. CH-015]|uniref:KH domain-containing protein n=1 Tax=Microbacterium sp. CH-015 TaxID=3406734 RepID=UPI003C710656
MSGTNDWVIDARRIAQRDLGSAPWIAQLKQELADAAEDDLGVYIVARAAMTQAASERAAELARQDAERAAVGNWWDGRIAAEQATRQESANQEAVRVVAAAREELASLSKKSGDRERWDKVFGPIAVTVGVIIVAFALIVGFIAALENSYGDVGDALFATFLGAAFLALPLIPAIGAVAYGIAWILAALIVGPVLLVSGSTVRAEKARVNERIASTRPSTVRLVRIPQDDVGKVIGKDGEVIKRIQQATGTRIELEEWHADLRSTTSRFGARPTRTERSFYSESPAHVRGSRIGVACISGKTAAAAEAARRSLDALVSGPADDMRR